MFKIEISEFRRLFDIPISYRMTDINRRVLTPAMNEVSQFFTSLSLTKEKEGKNIKYLKFTFDKEKRSVAKEDNTVDISIDQSNLALIDQPKENIVCPKCGQLLSKCTAKNGDTFWGHKNYLTSECKATYSTIEDIEAEREKRAIDVLDKVGLKDQIHKKPNQLSGGQMQRVAIARALVNNPSIVLADEPTGALDSETSVQVMELLKEVAKDRLVIMVTHNPKLANEYSTRIVELKDGKIISDSNPFLLEDDNNGIHKNFGKSSMSYLTSIALSFNNLKTKFKRQSSKDS